MKKSCRHEGGVKLRLESCVWELPKMEKVVEVLREKYENSARATIIRSSAKLIVQHAGHKEKGEVSSTRMLHFVASPNYCVRNSELLIHGVAGRTCSMEEGAPNSCSNLCCESGHKTRMVTVQKACKCEFKWCCKIECETCEEEEEQHKCK